MQINEHLDLLQSHRLVPLLLPCVGGQGLVQDTPHWLTATASCAPVGRGAWSCTAACPLAFQGRRACANEMGRCRRGPERARRIPVTCGAPLIAAVFQRGEMESRRKTFVWYQHKSHQREQALLERKRKKKIKRVG